MTSRTAFVHLAAAAAVLGGVALALATTQSEYGPVASETGAPAIGGKPAEANCTICHFDPDRENLNRPGGSIELLGLPAAYDPGVVYPVTVRLHSDSTAAAAGRKWGFQITAVRAADGEGTGTFLLNDPDTLQIVDGSGSYATRSYVEHTYLGVRQGIAGPVTWSFQWQAPASAAGSVHFYFAGNAANGSFDPGGDNIHTGSLSIADGSVPVRPVSWGTIKTLFR